METKPINKETAKVEVVYISALPIDSIFPSPKNRRKKKDNIAELASSISAQGLLHPINVRVHPEKGKDCFEIITGERRWRACKTLGSTIPAFIRNVTDQEADEMRATENLQREDLTPLEEAADIKTLLDSGRDTKEIADRIGRPLSWVIKRAKLVDLSAKWVKVIEKPDSEFSLWTASHLEIIARFDHKVQDDILDNRVNHYQSVSVSDLKEICDRYYLQKMNSAPWIRNEPENLLTGVPLCANCVKRTSAMPNLFDEIEESASKLNPDRCTDIECYQKKSRAFVESKAKSVFEEHGKDIVLLDRDPYGGILPNNHNLKTHAVKDYEVMTAKKTDANARLALIVDGPGAGTTTWVRSSNPDRPVKGGEKTMEQKKKELAKRRNNRVTGYVIEELVAIFQAPDKINVPTKDLLELLIRLVERFGASRLQKEINVYEYADPFKIATTKGTLESLLRCALPPIWKSLRDDQRANQPTPERSEQVCKWFGIDYKKLVATAIEAIPTPKAWAAQKKQEKKEPAKQAKKSSKKKSKK